MGGAVSAGEDNDDLVANLVEADYIRTRGVEEVCRAVDRGFYYTHRHRHNAYRDQAWKQGNLHLSAPCIYSQVLEALKLEPGQSFLNIGSGTGYLSTMAGLVLGHKGSNLGIELHADVVDYANKKLQHFLLHSDALYRYDFCEPVFLTGNGLALCAERQFDRIYCGASVLPEHCTQVQSLLKEKGILVTPMNDQLVQITHESSGHFMTKNLLAVSFASLVLPAEDRSRAGHEVRLPDWQPVALKVMCGRLILSLIRQVVANDVPIFQAIARPENGNQKRKKYMKRIAEAHEVLRPGSSDSSTDLSDDDHGVIHFNPLTEASLRHRMASLTAAIHRVVSHEVESSSSSAESDSGVAASPPVPVSTTVSSVQSTPSSSVEGRSKRGCSTTEEEDAVSPSSSSGGNSNMDGRLRLSRALAAGINERRRTKLQRMAQSSSSSSSSLSSSASSSATTSSSASTSDSVLRPIDECAADDEGQHGVHLLRARDDDRFVSLMQESVKKLPLPPILQSFVNLHRDTN